MKKSLIIVSIVFGVIIGVVMYFTLNKKDISNINIDTYVREYLSDTLKEEVSVKALIVNGYINSTKDNECNIYSLENDKIKLKESNCKKALEIAKKPVIKIESLNGFVLNKWNNFEARLKLTLKNGGNDYYSDSNIKSISWYNDSDSIKQNGDVFQYNDSLDDVIKVLVEFDDYSEVYSFRLQIDKEKPILLDKILNIDVLAYYDDNFGVDEVYYYVSLESKSPSKDMFSDVEFNYECDKVYHVWSYAKDIAGNESDIFYLGEYEKCFSVTSNR